MQVMSNEYNSIAQNDNARYYAVVKYNNEELNIDLQDFDYKGMINADDDITIGNTCSASVSFSLYNPDIVLTNKEIEIKQGLLVNGKIESLRMGFFTIQKPTSDGEVTEYVGYDRMIKAEKTYSSKLKFPAKTQDIMNEIASALGIVFATKLPKSYSISERPSGYTYREIIGFIAAMYGTNAIINRDGQLEFKWYTNVNYIIDGGRYYENGIEIDSENDYILQKITCVVAKNNETTTLTSGTGTQGISINNPLMTQSILNSIYDNIKSFTFRAMSVKFLGDFRIDLGDIITVKQNGKKYSVPVMQIEHQCDGGVITKITSVAKTEDEQEIDTSGPSTKAMNRYYAELVTINKALINKLDVDTAKITYATINNLAVVNEKVENLTAIAITTDNLVANVAKISTLTANSAIIANIKAVGINSTYINSQVAKLGYITSEKADLNYADIKLANIEIADIGKFFANCGLITSAVIKDGHITGYLDAVEINANNITAGTLTTDRLIIRGSDKSIIYELNNITGALQSKNVDTLNGEIITKRTIAADKIIAESITSKEIAADTITTDKLNVNDIFSNNAVITKLTTQDAFINNIATNEIIIKGILSNLEVGATNLLCGSIDYTADSKLSMTATTDDFSKQFADIYADLEEGETYTFNFKTDGTYGVSSIYPEFIATIDGAESTINLATLITDYSYSTTNINTYSENGYSGEWACRKIGNVKNGDVVQIRLNNKTTNSYNYILAKITKVISNTRVEATSLGCVMAKYDMPLLISGYSYNQTGIDKYSAYGYSGAWIVTDVSKVAINDVVRIRLKNSTTNKYNYIIAKITAIDTTNKKVTASSLAYVEASYGGIVCKKGNSINVKCNCTGGNGNLKYKFVVHNISTGNSADLSDWIDTNYFTFNISSTSAILDIVCAVKDELEMTVNSQYIRLFVGVDDDGSGYRTTSNREYLDTVEAYLLKDNATTTSIRANSLPYTFKCSKSGRYNLRLDVNKNGKTHIFWNFQIEKGNVATDWKPSNYDTETQIADTQDWINNKGINLYNMVLKWTGNAISDTTTINGGWISTNTITADKLAISTDGFVKDPMFVNWKDNTLPDGFADWGSSFANGKVNKVVENNSNLIEMIAVTNDELVGLASNGSSTSTTSLFSYKLSLDGLKCICVEIKFRLTNGVNPSGAGFVLDVSGYNASNTLINKRIICKLSDLGNDLTNNTWYTYRKIEKLDDEISACKLVSLNAYLLCNYSALGTLIAKTIQFASLNVYRATEQDYLTQSWTSGTYINGNALLTGSVTADSIATDAIKSKNYNNGAMGTEKLGAYFNLADGTMTTPYLSWDKRGQLKCSSADISGKVTASSGKIGNWNIQTKVSNDVGSSGMLYSEFVNTDSSGIGAKYVVHLAPINIHENLENTWVLASYSYDMPDETTARAKWYITYGGDFYNIGRYRCMGTTYPQIFGNGSVLQLSQDSRSSGGVVIDDTSFRPAGDINTGKNLGLSNHRWNTIFAASATIQTSDVNKKHDINELDDDVTKQLILGLIPKSYKFNDGTSGRTHYGLIAQDVEELLEKLEIDTKDFAGFVKSPKVKEYEIDKQDKEGNVVLDEGGNPQKELIREDIEGEYDYSLRYEEFISPLIKVVQMQQKMIEDLKADIQQLPP